MLIQPAGLLDVRKEDENLLPVDAHVGGGVWVMRTSLGTITAPCEKQCFFKTLMSHDHVCAIYSTFKCSFKSMSEQMVRGD